MGDFAKPAFGRAFIAANAAKTAKENTKADNEAKEEEQRQEAAKRVADSLEQGRTDTEASVQEFIGVARQQIEAGASPEQIESSRKVVGQIIDSYVGRIAQLQGMAVQEGQDASQFDPLLQFGEQQKQLFEESVNATQLQRDDTSEDFETLSPEGVAEMGFPEGAIVQRGPDEKVTLTFDPTQDKTASAFQEKVDALTPFVGEEMAVGIAGGRFAVSTNPITNESVVLDKATGEVVGEVEQPTPESTVPEIIPEDIATSVATGVPGALKQAANLIQDSIGLGTSFPDAQVATEAMKSIQVLTSITLQAEVPGRPSKFLLEKLDELTVKPNSIFQGETRAKTRLEQTRRILEGEIQRMEQEVLPLELDPKTRVDTQLNLSQMKRLRDAYDGLLKGFDEQEVDKELEDLLNKHAPEDKENKEDDK